MEANIKRVHYYHADTNALGGHIKTPFQQAVPVQAPLSLPPVGGYATARASAFQLQGVLSLAGAYTQVAGSVSEKNGAWTTVATSVVEGVNIHDILTADRLVSQIATEHPREGYDPKVTFIGTRFDNLRIGGYPLDVALDLGLCSPGGDRYPAKSCFEDESFLAGPWPNSTAAWRTKNACPPGKKTGKFPTGCGNATRGIIPTLTVSKRALSYVRW